MSALGDYFPARSNQRVPNMKYAADVENGGLGRVSLGPALVAADADGILNDQSIATASNTGTFLSTYAPSVMGKFGRCVTVVASGAATSTVTVKGRDYLGQPMTETLTLNGTTPVVGKKAFKTLDNVAWGVTAATTIDVGWGNVLGLPYKMLDIYSELVDNIETSDAGTFVKGTDATQSATSAEPRGTFAPHANNVPNAARVYALVGLFDSTQLHGIAHFST